MVEEYEVVNVTASARIERFSEEGLEELAESSSAIRYLASNDSYWYEPEEAGARALITRAGSILLRGASGAKQFDDLLSLLREEAEGTDIGNIGEYETKNVVAVADLGERCNLEALAIALDANQVEYEPEQFPGLVYKSPDLESTVLVFSSGKVVLTGGSSTHDVEEALESIEGKLTNHL